MWKSDRKTNGNLLLLTRCLHHFRQSFTPPCYHNISSRTFRRCRCVGGGRSGDGPPLHDWRASEMPLLDGDTLWATKFQTVRFWQYSGCTVCVKPVKGKARQPCAPLVSLQPSSPPQCCLAELLRVSNTHTHTYTHIKASTWLGEAHPHSWGWCGLLGQNWLTGAINYIYKIFPGHSDWEFSQSWVYKPKCVWHMKLTIISGKARLTLYSDKYKQRNWLIQLWRLPIKPKVGRQAMQKARQVPDLQTTSQSPSSEFLPVVEELTPLCL